MATGERVDLCELLSSLLQAKLPARNDLSEPDWTYWERRNLNMHRVVGLWRPGQTPDAAELGTETRTAMGRHFHRAWWRGLAWGVVIEVPEITQSPSDLKELIDIRENTRGTWQWLALVSQSRRTVLGVHTWIEGYLSPVYRSLLASLQDSGYQVTSVRREKDGLMKVLTAARPWLFPDFRENAEGKKSA